MSVRQTLILGVEGEDRGGKGVIASLGASMRDAFDQGKAAAGGLAGGLELTGHRLATLQKSFAAYQQAAAQVVAIAKTALELAQFAGEQERLSAAAGDGALAAFREGTGGLVNDMFLLKQAAMAAHSDFAMTADDMRAVAEAARALHQQGYGPIEDILQKLNASLRKGSADALAEYGIVVLGAKGKADAFAKSLDALREKSKELDKTSSNSGDSVKRTATTLENAWNGIKTVVGKLVALVVEATGIMRDIFLNPIVVGGLKLIGGAIVLVIDTLRKLASLIRGVIAAAWDKLGEGVDFVIRKFRELGAVANVLGTIGGVADTVSAKWHQLKGDSEDLGRAVAILSGQLNLLHEAQEKAARSAEAQVAIAIAIGQTVALNGIAFAGLAAANDNAGRSAHVATEEFIALTEALEHGTRIGHLYLGQALREAIPTVQELSASWRDNFEVVSDVVDEWEAIGPTVEPVNSALAGLQSNFGGVATAAFDAFSAIANGAQTAAVAVEAFAGFDRGAQAVGDTLGLMRGALEGVGTAGAKAFQALLSGQSGAVAGFRATSKAILSGLGDQLQVKALAALGDALLAPWDAGAWAAFAVYEAGALLAGRLGSAAGGSAGGGARASSASSGGARGGGRNNEMGGGAAPAGPSFALEITVNGVVGDVSAVGVAVHAALEKAEDEGLIPSRDTRERGARRAS